MSLYLSDGEDVASCRADRFQCVHRGSFDGVGGSQHLHDPFARVQFQRLGLKSGGWPGGQVLLGVAEGISERVEGGLKGRLDEFGFSDAGVTEQINSEEAGRDSYWYLVGVQELAAGKDVVAWFDAKASGDVLAGGRMPCRSASVRNRETDLW